MGIVWLQTLLHNQPTTHSPLYRHPPLHKKQPHQLISGPPLQIIKILSLSRQIYSNALSRNLSQVPNRTDRLPGTLHDHQHLLPGPNSELTEGRKNQRVQRLET